MLIYRTLLGVDVAMRLGLSLMMWRWPGNSIESFSQTTFVINRGEVGQADGCFFLFFNEDIF